MANDKKLYANGAGQQARQMSGMAGGIGNNAPKMGATGVAPAYAASPLPTGANLNPTGSVTPAGGANLKPTGSVDLGSTLAGTEASMEGGNAGGVGGAKKPIIDGSGAIKQLAGQQYQSAWQDQLSGLLDQIMNRGNFNYNINGDALYNQYKDLYTQQGRQAMMDTMGQATAMTGGYGSSYAQSAGQQAYQQSMTQLQERIPELYQLAQDTYNQQTQNLYNQANLMSQMDERDYGRWNDDRNWQYGLYRDSVSDQQWQDQFDWNKSTWQQEFDYGKERDTVSDQQWEREFNEAIREFDLNYGKSTGRGGGGGGSGSRGKGGGGGSGSGSGGGGYDNGGLTTAQIKAMQQALGITADGKWGAQSIAAAKARWGKANANWDGSAIKAWSVYNSQF